MIPRLASGLPCSSWLDRMEWAGAVSFVCHGARIGVRATRMRTVDAVARTFPPGARVVETAEVDCLYSWLTEGTGDDAATHRLFVGSEQLLATSDGEEILATLASDLHFRVAVAAPDRLFVHAGVVAWQGRAIVVPGRSGAGKTSLVLGLVRAGATYYSDEYAVFDAEGRVHPYPRPLAVREQWGAAPVLHPVETLGGQAGTTPVPLGLVVVSRYEAGAHWSPRAMSVGEAVLALLDNTVLARVRPELALKTLSRAVPGARAVQGTRGEASEVIQAIIDRAVEPTASVA